MSSKHTPGPWTPDRDPRIGMEWNIHILDQRGHAICFMAHSDGASNERDEANAVLVAAAPDLLEALKQIEPILTRMYGPQAAELPPMQVVRAAIAKAEAA